MSGDSPEDEEGQENEPRASHEAVDGIFHGPPVSKEYIAAKQAVIFDKEYERQRDERREFAEYIMGVACKRTGMTEEQIRTAWQGLDIPRVMPNGRNSPEIHAKSLMQTAGVPILHMENMLHPKPSPLLDFVGDFVKSPERVLILSGDKGIGKTAVACWALSKVEGLFVKAAKLLSIAFEDAAALRQLTKVRFVVLDDLGAEIHDEKGHWLRVFNDLFDDWYGNKTRLIITTNLNAERFKDAYGERVADRVRESGRFKLIAGESMRGK